MIAVVGIKYSNTGTRSATPLTNKPATDVSKVPTTVKLPPGATTVARRFIQTAVARKNLAEAYSIVTEQILQGQSLKSWKTGNIAVIPYPVDDDQVRADEDRLLVSERGADRGRAAARRRERRCKAQLFIMDLVKRDGKWLVNSWVPRSSPPVPNGSANNGAGS